MGPPLPVLRSKDCRPGEIARSADDDASHQKRRELDQPEAAKSAGLSCPHLWLVVGHHVRSTGGGRVARRWVRVSLRSSTSHEVGLSDPGSFRGTFRTVTGRIGLVAEITPPRYTAVRWVL